MAITNKNPIPTTATGGMCGFYDFEDIHVASSGLFLEEKTEGNSNSTKEKSSYTEEERLKNPYDLSKQKKYKNPYKLKD